MAEVAMKAMEERIQGLAAEVAVMKTEVQNFANQLATEKETFTDEVNLEFARHKLAITEVVEGARGEFTKVQGTLS